MSDPGTVVSERLRGLLVCPGCRGELSDHASGLACRACDCLYPVVDGIPRLVPEESKRLARTRNGRGR